jgi:hypothetical protein
MQNYSNQIAHAASDFLERWEWERSTGWKNSNMQKRQEKVKHAKKSQV